MKINECQWQLMKKNLLIKIMQNQAHFSVDLEKKSLIYFAPWYTCLCQCAKCFILLVNSYLIYNNQQTTHTDRDTYSEFSNGKYEIWNVKYTSHNISHREHFSVESLCTHVHKIYIHLLCSIFHIYQDVSKRMVCVCVCTTSESRHMKNTFQCVHK